VGKYLWVHAGGAFPREVHLHTLLSTLIFHYGLVLEGSILGGDAFAASEVEVFDCTDGQQEKKIGRIRQVQIEEMCDPETALPVRLISHRASKRRVRVTPQTEEALFT
jgi:hypothetical protein